MGPDFQYRQYPPSALLADLVECYWTFRTSALIPPGQKERLIPGGRVELIFNFAAPLHWLIDDLSSGYPVISPHLMGQRDRIYYCRPSGPSHLLGIRFRTGGPARFIKTSLSQLLNKMIPAEDILGPTILEWETRLLQHQDDRTRISLIDQLLIQKQTATNLPGNPVLQHAIGFIRQNDEPSPIASFCNDSGWSYKKLERAFLQEIGYTPKAWHRLVRFNKALRYIDTARDQSHTAKHQSLTKIGYHCGYYDQSHFIKDFRRYAGASPQKFEAAENSIAAILIRNQPV
jgi:AraC-like DNA-binding protein